MESIFQQIITEKMAMLAAGAIAIMIFIGRFPIKGKKINTFKIWKDYGIFLLVAICTAGSFAPGVNDIPVKEWGSVLVFAFVTALVALLGRAILKRIIINRLEGKNNE